jgi:hypothetical protein
MLTLLWGTGLVVGTWFTLPRREKMIALRDLLGMILGLLLLGVLGYYFFS